MNFSELMETAHRTLGCGDTQVAIRQFEQAGEAAGTSNERAQALQMKGVALRVDGQFKDAEGVLERAMTLAEEADDVVLAARIQRDLGMSLLDRITLGRTDLAGRTATLFMQSGGILSEHGEHVEAAVSDGFLGRLYFEIGRKEEATQTLRRVFWQLLGKHPVYELNNLVWLARASVRDRWRYASYGFRLIAATGHVRRRKEYFVLLVGGNRLYEVLSRQSK